MPINYQALVDMQMSDDPRAQAIASQAAKNMTPDEFKEFYDFQQAGNAAKGIGSEIDRKDASLFGMPPELAAAGAVKLPLMAGSAMKDGLGAIGSEAGGLARTGLTMYGINKAGEALGVPKELRDILMMATGLKGSGIAGGAAKGAGMAAEAEAGALSAAEKAALAKQGYSPELISKIEGAASKGSTAAPFKMPEQTMPSLGPRPPKVEMKSPAASTQPRVSLKHPTEAPDEIAEQVGRGVQNDFKGPVSFDSAIGAKRRAYQAKPQFDKREMPPGTTNKTSPDEFINQSNAFSNYQVDPQEVNSVQQAIRDALDAGKPKLRKPK